MMGISSNSGLGINQVVNNVKAARALGVTYYNTTGNPISIHVYCRGSGSAGQKTVLGYVDGLLLAADDTMDANYTVWVTGAGSVVLIVPPNSSYMVTGTGCVIQTWVEIS